MWGFREACVADQSADIYFFSSWDGKRQEKDVRSQHSGRRRAFLHLKSVESGKRNKDGEAVTPRDGGGRNRLQTVINKIAFAKYNSLTSLAC